MCKKGIKNLKNAQRKGINAKKVHWVYIVDKILEKMKNIMYMYGNDGVG